MGEQSGPFEEDHEAFRESVAAFLSVEIAPAWDGWLAGGAVPHTAYVLDLSGPGVTRRPQNAHGAAGVEAADISVEDVSATAVVPGGAPSCARSAGGPGRCSARQGRAPRSG